MKISLKPSESRVFGYVKKLVLDGDTDLFRESHLLKLISGWSSEGLSIIFLCLALVCLWYKVAFIQSGMAWVHDYKLWAIFLLFAFLTCDKKRLLSTKANTYLVLFVVALVLSSLWAVLNGLEAGMLITGALSISIFPISFIISSTYSSKMRLINTILVLSFPLLVIGCIHGLFGDSTSVMWVSTGETLVRTRAFGILENPNALGGLSMIVVIIDVFAFMIKKKWYYVVYAVIALAALGLTFSRSSWLGLSLGLLCVALIKYWRLIFLSPLGCIVLLVPSIRQRVVATFSQEYLVSASLDGRFWAYDNAIEIFGTSPIVGVGPGTQGLQNSIYYNSPIYLRGAQNGYVASAYSDTQWFQILAQCGIVGIFMVVMFFVSYLINSCRTYQESKNYLNLGTIAVAVAMIISGFFENVWGFGVMAVLAGSYMGLGNSYNKHSEQSLINI